jgi:hypothetical protein
VLALRYWYVKPDAVPLSELKVGAIIKTSRGRCDLESEAKMLGIFKGAKIVEPKTWCRAATEMERSFAEAAEQKLEVLIALGADGTIRTAAEACAQAEKNPLQLFNAARLSDAEFLLSRLFRFRSQKELTGQGIENFRVPERPGIIDRHSLEAPLVVIAHQVAIVAIHQ